MAIGKAYMACLQLCLQVSVSERTVQGIVVLAVKSFLPHHCMMLGT